MATQYPTLASIMLAIDNSSSYQHDPVANEYGKTFTVVTEWGNTWLIHRTYDGYYIVSPANASSCPRQDLHPVQVTYMKHYPNGQAVHTTVPIWVSNRNVLTHTHPSMQVLDIN
jgi:hypothetical protein